MDLLSQTKLVLVFITCGTEQFRVNSSTLRVSSERTTKEENVWLWAVSTSKGRNGWVRRALQGFPKIQKEKRSIFRTDELHSAAIHGSAERQCLAIPIPSKDGSWGESSQDPWGG